MLLFFILSTREAFYLLAFKVDEVKETETQKNLAKDSRQVQWGEGKQPHHGGV